MCNDGYTALYYIVSNPLVRPRCKQRPGFLLNFNNFIQLMYAENNQVYYFIRLQRPKRVSLYIQSVKKKTFYAETFDYLYTTFSKISANPVGFYPLLCQIYRIKSIAIYIRARSVNHCYKSIYTYVYKQNKRHSRTTRTTIG